MKDPGWLLLYALLVVAIAGLVFTRGQLKDAEAELRQTRAKLLDALENQPVRSTGDHSIPYYPEKP